MHVLQFLIDFLLNIDQHLIELSREDGAWVNYAIGRRFGNLIAGPESRWVRPEHIDRTNAFFARHGGRKA